MENKNQSTETLLNEGLVMIQLEERLEMVQLTAAAAASLLCDFGSVEVSASKA